ncbi:MAG: Rho termination factor N-terminal domain-containing protein [Acidimicrobiales bacterium]
MPAPLDEPEARRFDFAFEPAYRILGRLLSVTPASAFVEVGGDVFHARFGPWRVRTGLTNVTGVSVTGPYSFPKTIGPAHLSFRDGGLTFATSSRQGVCVAFRNAVGGLDPLSLLRHPALTVTVADSEGLVQALRSVGAQRSDLDEIRQEQAAEDQLHTMTARELRRIADARGVPHTSSMKKADLVELLDGQAP